MYINRNAKGEIALVSRMATPDCMEFMPAGTPELQAFMAQGDEEGDLRLLRSTDNEYVRVLEDVIDLLSDKGLISIDELPGPARKKLETRQTLRSRIGSDAATEV